ncbi:MAG: hypothetical protein ACK5O7_05505 [Holosporales bacterium]
MNFGLLKVFFVALLCLHTAVALPDPATLSHVPKDTVLKEASSLKASLFRGQTLCESDLNAQTSAFEHLVVKGNLTLVDSEIFGQSQIGGDVRASNSHFRDAMILNGQKAHFDESVIATIICDQPAKITLAGSTFVGGNIEFKGPAGHVIIVGDSQVLGKVINGTVSQR